MTLAATAITADLDPRTDEALRLFWRWRASQNEADRLTLAWQRVEAYLFSHHNWTSLSDAAQRALPAAAPLYALDDRLADLDVERDALLAGMSRTNARSAEGFRAKLKVLEYLLRQEDHPQAHALIRSARLDYDKLAARPVEQQV